MFGLKAPNLNSNLLIYIYIYFNIVISKFLNITFNVVTHLLSRINIAFQSASIWLNLSESLFKHKGYEYTNIIFTTVIHLF